MPFNCSLSPLREDLHLSPARMQVFVAMHALLTVASIVLPVVFCVAKHWYRLERLYVRKTSLVILAGAASFIHAQAGPGMNVFGRWQYPCWIRSVLSMLVVPAFCANLLIKLTTFYFQAQLNRGIAEVDRVDDDIFQQTSSSFSGFREFGLALLTVLVPSRTIAQNRLVVAFSFITSRRGTIWFTLTLTAISVVSALAVSSTRPEFSNGCTGCFLSIPEALEIAALAVLLIVFIGIFACRAWHFPDPWGLRHEVFLSGMCCVLILVGFLGGVYFDFAGDVPYDHQVEMCLGFTLILWVQTALQAYKGWVEDQETKKRVAKHMSKVQMFSSRALPNLAKEDRGDVRFDVSMNTDGGTVEEQGNEDDEFNDASHTDLLTLDKVLGNAQLSKAFEEFMIAELSVESLMFIKDTDEWKRAYFTVAPNARVVRARRLFNVYIAINAKFEINISSKCSKQVKDSFARGGGVLLDVPLDVFDWARKEIADMLQYGSILRFQLTPQYRQLQLQLDKEQQQQQQRAPKLQRKSIFS